MILEATGFRDSVIKTSSVLLAYSESPLCLQFLSLRTSISEKPALSLTCLFLPPPGVIYPPAESIQDMPSTESLQSVLDDRSAVSVGSATVIEQMYSKSRYGDELLLVKSHEQPMKLRKRY